MIAVKIKKGRVIMIDYSSFFINRVPKVGLEPTQALCPRDFKSLVSTIPPFRQPDLRVQR